MKKLLFIVLLFISTSVSAQTFRITKHNVIKAKIENIYNDKYEFENFVDSVFTYAEKHKAVKVKFFCRLLKVAEYDTSKDFDIQTNINNLNQKIEAKLHSNSNYLYYLTPLPHGIAHYSGSIQIDGVTHSYHSTIRY